MKLVRCSIGAHAYERTAQGESWAVLVKDLDTNQIFTGIQHRDNDGIEEVKAMLSSALIDDEITQWENR